MLNVSLRQCTHSAVHIKNKDIKAVDDNGQILALGYQKKAFVVLSEFFTKAAGLSVR